MRLYELYQSQIIKRFGERFDLDKIREVAAQIDDQSLAVADVAWTLEHAGIDEIEAQDADAAVPIIVTKHGDKVYVIDGLLQVAKAVQQEQKSLYAKFIDEDDLRSCIIKRS